MMICSPFTNTITQQQHRRWRWDLPILKIPESLTVSIFRSYDGLRWDSTYNKYYIAQTILPFGDMPIAIVSVSCPQQGHMAATAIISTSDTAKSP